MYVLYVVQKMFVAIIIFVCSSAELLHVMQRL